MRLFISILRALCALALGFFMVSRPGTSAELTIQIIGGLFALTGLLAVISHFTSHEGGRLRHIYPLVGLGSLAFGTVLIAWPAQFLQAFMYFFGVLLVLLGLNQMWLLVANRRLGPLSFSLFFIPLLVVITAGVMIVLYPTESASLPFTVFGIAAICYGVSEIFLSIRQWRLQRAYDAQFIEAEELSSEPGQPTSDPAGGRQPEAILPTDTPNSQSDINS